MAEKFERGSEGWLAATMLIERVSAGNADDRSSRHHDLRVETLTRKMSHYRGC